MEKLSALPNIGSVLEANLAQVGIDTLDQLREKGAKQAFLDIRASADPCA